MKKKNLIIIGIIVALLFFAGIGYAFINRAQNIRTTNVTSRSATITWNTTLPVKGKVSYCPVAKDTENCAEEMKTVDTSKASTNHYLELESLDSNQNHKFIIKNGFYGIQAFNSFAEDMSLTKNSEFKTYNILDEPLVPTPIYGKVECVNEETKEECFSNTILFLEISGHSPISTKINDTGGWSLDLSATRNLETEETAKINTENQPAKIFADAARFGNSEIKSIEFNVNEGLIKTVKIKN